MECNGIDRIHYISARLTLPVALEGILLCLSLLTTIKVLHSYPALN